MRGALGYAIRMYPQTSETFIVNEILELERRGVSVQVFSYLPPKEIVPHAALRNIRGPVHYLPHPAFRHPRQIGHHYLSVRTQLPHRVARTLGFVTRGCLADARRGAAIHALQRWPRLAQAICLASLALQQRISHLHAHFAHEATEVAMLASLLTGIPFSFTAHARDIYSHDVDKHLLREKVQHARAAVTVSHHNRVHITQEVGTALADRVQVIYNGIDLDIFHPNPGVTCEAAYVLGIGRLVEKKGFSTLVEACAILRNQQVPFRCEIVGDGPERTALEALITRLQLTDQVSLLGVRPQEEIPDLLRRATLLAMPAVIADDGNRDALPTVLLEALACGTPVVASRLTGIPEIVDHGVNGLLVAPADPAELAGAVRLLLMDEPLRQRFGEAGRAKAEWSFDVKQSIDRLVQVFGMPEEKFAGAH